MIYICNKTKDKKITALLTFEPKILFAHNNVVHIGLNVFSYRIFFFFSSGVPRGAQRASPPRRNSAPLSCPLWNYTLYRIESRHFEPQPAPLLTPELPLPPPHFEKSGYALAFRYRFCSFSIILQILLSTVPIFRHFQNHLGFFNC